MRDEDLTCLPFLDIQIPEEVLMLMLQLAASVLRGARDVLRMKLHSARLRVDTFCKHNLNWIAKRTILRSRIL